MKRLATLLAVFLLAAFSRAQSFEIVHSFGPIGGGGPVGVMIDPDGTLHGVTSDAGFLLFGSVFQLRPDGLGGYVFTEPAEFWGQNGSYPDGNLTRGLDGYLYGTTAVGGEHFGMGTIFRVDPAGNLTVVHGFDDATDGGYPRSTLIVATDGSLWGTTSVGGPSGSGTVFRLGADGVLATVHGFNDADGSAPSGRLLLASDGGIYGTTRTGGANSAGSIFRIDAGGTFATLHDFAGTDGSLPFAGLAEGPDHRFYGTAASAGQNGVGTVFRIDAAGQFEKLHDFQGTDGSSPQSELIPDPAGGFFGAASAGGANQAGTLFHIDEDGTFATLHDFTFDEGNGALLRVRDAGDGALYGVTGSGGPAGGGTVFRFASGTLTTLRAFGGTTALVDPYSGLLPGAGGLLYGTTAYASPQGGGGIFSIDADDHYAVVRAMTSDEGRNLSGELADGGDGFFYGTARDGGNNDNGTIFRFDAAGTFTVLHTFTDLEAGSPQAGLTPASGGAFWGAAIGGPGGAGTVFQLDSSNVITTTHTFMTTDGASPEAPPVEVGGVLYGTTAGGGPVPLNDDGTVYRIDGTTLTTVHAFNRTDGAAPMTPLLAADDGNLYGTTFIGGTFDHGTVFRIGVADAFSTLYNFALTDGGSPGPLIQGSDGNLYGVATSGGKSGMGTVFRLDLDGNLTTLYSFDGQGGSNPYSRLLEQPQGTFYGTSALGGLNNLGVVFRILLEAAAPAPSSISPTSGSGGTCLVVAGVHFGVSPSVFFAGPSGSGASVIGIDSRTIRAIAPPLTPATLYDVVVENPDVSTGTLPKAWFADFLDVNSINPFHDFVESVFRAGITAGCGGGNYCGTAPVTRAQMAVFLLKAEHGSTFTPPPCTGLFTDVPCPGGFAVDWIEQLSIENITGGCGGTNYCPTNPVRRDQMAVFLLKASLGSGYIPPPATGTVFADVPASAFAAAWIENLYALNVTGGCLTNPLRYCPSNTSNRQQMAVFITKTFGLQ